MTSTAPTIHYRALFHNVRHFEQFTALHLGVLAETRRASLPRLGTTVHTDPQALHHFLAKAEWSVEAVRTQRLALLRMPSLTPRRPWILERLVPWQRGFWWKPMRPI